MARTAAEELKKNIIDKTDAKIEEKISESENQPPVSEKKVSLLDKYGAEVPGIGIGKDLIVWNERRTKAGVVSGRLKVEGLPEELTYKWCAIGEVLETEMSDPDIPWRKVRVEDASSDPDAVNQGKLYIKNFEDYHGYVRYLDTVLLVARKSVVDFFSTLRRSRWNSQLETYVGKEGRTNANLMLQGEDGRPFSIKRNAERGKETIADAFFSE